jgi:type I restriction enzyme M protein
MYRVDRNNFYRHEKEATVCTPDHVSEFLFELISPRIPKSDGIVVDPCVGKGSLLKPWRQRGYQVCGIDIEDQGFRPTKVKNYLEVRKDEIKGNVSLVIMNPPFNIDGKTKAYIKEHYGGRPLLPEIWFAKAVELFGHRVPIVMFTPYGFRLNQTENSKRWLKFANAEYPPITAIISLPKDVFEGVLFHSEILVFNIRLPKGHYFVRNRHEHERAASPKRQPALA